MFENILGQETVVRLLSQQLQRDAVPHAVLFHGLPYTGKSSTALELARALSCETPEAVWNCGCPSCVRHRALTHPNLLMLGSRYYDVEIAASADAYLRTHLPATRYLFVRAVRKLLRRFDAVLLERESAAVRRSMNLVSEIEEVLDQEEFSEKEIEGIAETAGRLMTAAGAGSIPVSQVRAVTGWSHTTGGTKTVLMENVETLQESSRNALLKLLEEPPSGVYLILTANRPGALMATLRSRLRPYHFSDRPPALQRQVLARIFREESEEYPSLRDYFLAWRDLNPAAMRGLATRFVDLLQQPPEDPSLPGLASSLISEALQAGKPAESLTLFAEELLSVIQQRLRDNSLPVSIAERWSDLVRDQIIYARGYNPSPSLVMESLLYRMRERRALVV
jgi:DNA polymerase-3 subunit gamma/tau